MMIEQPRADAFTRLQNSVDRFHAALHSSPYGGMSRIAELAALKVLVDKYPSEARRMVDERK
jgi:hypothetical protein